MFGVLATRFFYYFPHRYLLPNIFNLDLALVAAAGLPLSEILIVLLGVDLLPGHLGRSAIGFMRGKKSLQKLIKK